MIQVSEEMLNALIDDELDADESQLVREQISDDPALQRRVDDLLTLKYMVRSTRWEGVWDTATQPTRKKCVPLRTAAIAATLVALISSALMFGWDSFQSRNGVVVAANQNQAVEPLTRVLLHFSSDSVEDAEQLLDQTEYLLADYQKRGEPIRVEVIENGRNLMMLRESSLFADRIREITSKYGNVSFAACLSTKSSLEATLGRKIGLLPDAEVVDSGVAKIMELQKKGWMYLRG